MAESPVNERPAMTQLHIHRRAAIDIGTVTCRLLVADVGDDGSLTKVYRDSNIANLGEGVDATRRFSGDAMARVRDTVATFAQAVEGLAQDGPIPIVAVGTSACRDAENSQELVDMLADVGVQLQVIPGQREAELTFAGASRSLAGQSILVADIGGGSTELIAGVAGEGVHLAHSFDIGCRRVTDRFLSIDPPDPAQMQQARDWYVPQFQGFFDQMAEQGLRIDKLVAVAGTATTAVAIDQAMETYDSSKVHGRVLGASELDAILQRLAALPLAERLNVVGLQPQRAPVIVAGLMILRDLVELAGTGCFVASESDILQGIVTAQF